MAYSQPMLPGQKPMSWNGIAHLFQQPEQTTKPDRYAPPPLADWQKQVAGLTDWQSAGKLWNSIPSATRMESFRKATPSWSHEYKDAMRENPYWQEWAARLKEANKGGGGFFHKLGHSLSSYPGAVGSLFNTYQGREMLIKAGLFAGAAAGGIAASGGFSGGAGAASGAGSGGFVAGTGAGGSLGGVGGMHIGSTLLRGALAANALNRSNAGGGGGGGGGMDWGSLASTGLGTLLGSVLNRQQVPGKDLSRAPFESGDLQRYLPPELRAGATGPLIGAGISGIGDLLRNPGGLNPGIADAIRPRLAAESQDIAQNYRGIQSNQAGAAARSNTPMSIKGALQSALDVAQERAQRGARNEAMQQSETLRRADLERVFQILDAILQFQQAGRGTATAGLGPGTALESQKTAAMMALIGNLLGSGARANG